MKPSEIYKLTPISVTNYAGILTHHLFYLIREIEQIDWDKCQNIEIKHYVCEMLSFEDSWQFYSVWFYGIPVMVCELGGEDDYHVREYVTNGLYFRQMIEYLRTLLPDPIDNYSTHNPEEDIPKLGIFYGHSLTDFYKN